MRAVVIATCMSGCAHSAWFSVATAAALIRNKQLCMRHRAKHAPPSDLVWILPFSGRDAQQRGSPCTPRMVSASPTLFDIYIYIYIVSVALEAAISVDGRCRGLLTCPG